MKKILFLSFTLFFAAVSFPPAGLPEDARALKELGALTPKQRTQLAAGKPLVFPLKISDVDGSQAFCYLPYSPEFIYDMMHDYASFPKWLHRVEAITSTKWVSPDVALVGYRVRTPIRTVNYILRRVHNRPNKIRWTRVSGDLLVVTGGYDFYPEGSGMILRAYMEIEPAFWVPWFLRSLIAKKGMQELVEDVKHEAQRRSESK